jgi:hypothetical protein
MISDKFSCNTPFIIIRSLKEEIISWKAAPATYPETKTLESTNDSNTNYRLKNKMDSFWTVSTDKNHN